MGWATFLAIFLQTRLVTLASMVMTLDLKVMGLICDICPSELIIKLMFAFFNLITSNKIKTAAGKYVLNY
jgi:hypothetical protein